MIARIAILAALIATTAPQARPFDVAALAVAVAHVERLPVDAANIIATAYVETGGSLRPALVSRAGACGVMQVIPKWSALTCAQLKQPLGGVLGGVMAWYYWEGYRDGRERYSTAAHYNGGKSPGSRAQVYARNWAYHRKRIARAMGRYR
jgi:soluble lytic murein transglycosylase-like protein